VAWDLAQSWEGQNQVVSVAAEDEKHITIAQASDAFVASCTNRASQFPRSPNTRRSLNSSRSIAKSRGM